MISQSSLLAILGMLCATYSTRLAGYFLLKGRRLSRRSAKMMEAAPGCVLLAVLAPYFAADRPHELAAIAVTAAAAAKLPMLPAVLVSVAASALLMRLLP